MNKIIGLITEKNKHKSIDSICVGIVLIFFASLTLPLILQTLIRPFGLWDYFTIWHVMGIDPEFIYDNSKIAILLKKVFFTNDFIYRPFSMLFYYLYIRVFKGSFWILMILKWAAKFLTLYLLFLFNKKVNCNKFLYLFILSFLLFHTAVFEVMTFSVDGYLAFFIIMLTYYIYSRMKKYGSLSINKYSKYEYYTLIIIFALMSGIKEMSVIMLITTVVLFTATSILEKCGIPRLIPMYLIVVFTVVRILQIASSRLSNSDNNNLRNIFNIWCTLIKDVLEIQIAHGVLAMTILVILGGGIYKLYKKSELNDLIFIIYLTLSIIGMTLFSSISTDNLALRYIIPIYFLLGELILLLCKNYSYRMNYLFIILSVFIPILCISNIYGQHLAYANQFEQQQIMLNYILEEKKQQPNLDIILSDRDEVTERFFSGQELQTSIRGFFGYLGNKWYGTPLYNVISIDKYNQEDQINEGLWMTTYNIQQAQDLISKGCIDTVYVAEAQGTTLRNIYNFFRNIDNKLGLPTTISYDVGASELRNESYWNLYRIKPNSKVDETKTVNNITSLKYENYAQNISFEFKIDSDYITIPAGDCARLSLAMNSENKEFNSNYTMKGQIEMMSGEILYGFGDSKGNMYIGKNLSGKGKYDIDASYLKKGNEDVQFFIFIPNNNVNTKLKINNIKLSTSQVKLKTLKNVKQYGGFQ